MRKTLPIGVCYRNDRDTYRVGIYHDGKYKNLGSFKKLKDAVMVRYEAEVMADKVRKDLWKNGGSKMSCYEWLERHGII